MTAISPALAAFLRGLSGVHANNLDEYLNHRVGADGLGSHNQDKCLRHKACHSVMSPGLYYSVQALMMLKAFSVHKLFTVQKACSD